MMAIDPKSFVALPGHDAAGAAIVTAVGNYRRASEVLSDGKGKTISTVKAEKCMGCK